MVKPKVDDMIDEQFQRLLARSSADESFKAAINQFCSDKRSDLIQYPAGSPRIKILRVLMKLLEEFPNEPITDVHIEAKSTCSTYAGYVEFGPNRSKVRFKWDCLWKAKQEGLVTWYGEPDQTKAAKTFGYQCFEEFQQITSN